MSYEFLYQPIESSTNPSPRSSTARPLLVAMGLAFLLGLRHASDPDHLVAVTSLVAADDAL